MRASAILTKSLEGWQSRLTEEKGARRNKKEGGRPGGHFSSAETGRRNGDRCITEERRPENEALVETAANPKTGKVVRFEGGQGAEKKGSADLHRSRNVRQVRRAYELTRLDDRGSETEHREGDGEERLTRMMSKNLTQT